MHPAGETSDDVEIEERDGFLEARFLGRFAVDRFNRQVDAAALACRQRKLSLLLIDVTRLQADLSTLDRFDIGSHGARVASDLKVAMFSAPELVDPKKFGVLVARNRGLTIDIFTDRKAAVDWLLAPR
jgi:hypothetical protein